MRTLAIALAAAALAALGSPSIARAQGAGASPATAAQFDAKRKINLAGRQRMLTQFMAKGTCFVSLGVDDKAQINEVYSVHDLFEQTLTDLRKGNPDLQLLPEQDDQVVAALDLVLRDWKLYSRAVMQGDLEAIIAQNLIVLGTMNDVVGLIEKKYGASGKVAPEIAAAINIAGRQRMLSQRASKELCLIAAGHAADVNTRNLKETIALFDKSLQGLRDGDAALGLKKAPTPAIAEALKTGEAEWLKLKGVLERTLQAGKPSIEDVATVAKLNMPVLDAMDDLVDLYEGLGG